MSGGIALRKGMQLLPSVVTWFCCSSSSGEKKPFGSLPSVVSWKLPSILLQKRKRELLLETIVDTEQGQQTFTGLAVGEKEFRLFLAHSLPSMDADALAVTDRFIDIEDAEVRSDLRRRWTEGRMLMKNISYKDAMAEDRSFGGELKGYLKKLADFDSEKMDPPRVRAWLSSGYGSQGMQDCIFNPKRSVNETRDTLLPMLHWFRHNYPYYHKGCFACKNESTIRVGNTLSSAEERAHVSGRTELVYCEECRVYSRFARYSSLEKILDFGRGRCGEYSTAFYHVMRALGYRTRWVVDWTDHVWVEVDVQGAWMHIDPCEAAFNDKRMYIGWGKKHTYVVAFSEDGLEDVTAEYADDMKEVAKRRDLSEPDVEKALKEAQEVWATNYSKAVVA